MYRFGGIAAVSVAVAAPVWAGPSEPTMASAGDWVETIPAPEPDPAQAQKAVQLLLLDAQSYYGPETHDYFVRTVTLIQTPPGLAAMGTVAISWQPESSELVIHKLHIVREGKIIDVLADQAFTVVRREGNLERAMLDGTLTAFIQPSDLAVGDVVDVAYTIRRKPGAIDHGAENLTLVGDTFSARRARAREIWPAGLAMRWRASKEMGTPRTRKTKLGTELTVDLADVALPKPPADAPPRFQIPGWLQVSSYEDWNTISRAFAPAFKAATTLSTDSRLKGEIARIAEASSDPRIRAMAALRLVQDKIRYVALNMGEGALTPASADETWARKYGDCKGKTAVLIALLRDLGIEAEPVLVSSYFGDALPERLPQMRMFDHVLVRATIDGRSYWLDGTRSGDRKLDELASAPFGWGLPVRTDGTGLEQIPFTPPSLPIRESSITYDASAGFAASVPYKAEIRFRGDVATALQFGFSQIGKEKLLENMSAFMTDMPERKDISSYAFASDDASGTFTFTFNGKSSMDWNAAPSSRAVRFRFSDDVISWDIKLDREAGPYSALPHWLPAPAYVTSRETVILPMNGAGFTIDGKSFDRTIAGTHIARTVSIEDGKATAFSSFNRLQREVSAADATASAEGIKALKSEIVYIRSPEGYEPSEAEIDAIIKTEPTTASGYVDRGYRLMGRGELSKAIADFDKAIEMSPRWARPLANKAIALLHQGKKEEAEPLLAKASEFGDTDFVVHQGYGMLHAMRDEPEKAIQSHSRAIALDPDNSFSLMQRATAYENLGRYRDALADVEQALALENSEAYVYQYKARLLAELGEVEPALAAISEAARIAPDDAFLAGYRGELLLRFGRKEEGHRALDAAIALTDKELARSSTEWASIIVRKSSLLSIKGDHKAAIDVASRGLQRQFDNVGLLTARCLARAYAGIELDKALKDCDLAVDYGFGNLRATQARALVKLRMGKFDAAIADYDLALSYSEHNAHTFYGRAVAKQAKGDNPGAVRDFAAARRYGFDVHFEFDDMGLKPQLTGASQ